MPQVDLSTFLPIAFGTIVLYLSGFLIFNLTVFFDLFGIMKLLGKRTCRTYLAAMLTQAVMTTLAAFAGIAL